MVEIKGFSGFEYRSTSFENPFFDTFVEIHPIKIIYIVMKLG
ncbi:hypothetical protein [Clostridium beijerinckii]|jgi:hypothetical protein|nr:hypothetical protein [Clostridium beijerinckii]NOW91945.1 hypothetical protein [Clostridium beijerinckii]NRT24507.1 hypothetical protein [Clostridium beijerinckii]NRT67900.1 hypothetical protein [Clostridium beijerinckii]NRT85585.1 hypothetical protein [Clostridium beijerinckii]NRU47476.1 hypothetical protein [Clostridium beijerinckii]